MRFAYSIPDHREYLRSGYPSEPLLAEAAAQQLRVWRTQKPFAVVETLTNMFQSIVEGSRSLLVGKLLLDAYHRAVELDQVNRCDGGPPDFSAGCHLITFIKISFSDEYADMVLAQITLKGSRLERYSRKLLAASRTFGKMADDTGITSTAAWVASIRHMAIMCRNGERGVDCIFTCPLAGH